MGSESQVRTLMPNFTFVALKMWAYSSQYAKYDNFSINLPLRENPRGRWKTCT